MDFALLAAECAPWVATQTMAAIVRAKSQFNPVKKIVVILWMLATPHVSFADDACKLYLCLMGASESDGGTECVTSIKNYTDNFKKSCPNLPTCIGTSGPITAGILMTSVYGSGGSTQGPENGRIVQVCVEVDTPYGPFCGIALTAPATKAGGGNYASCGGE